MFLKNILELSIYDDKHIKGFWIFLLK